jgi:hypothetical protein
MTKVAAAFNTAMEVPENLNNSSLNRVNPQTAPATQKFAYTNVRMKPLKVLINALKFPIVFSP